MPQPQKPKSEIEIEIERLYNEDPKIQGKQIQETIKRELKRDVSLGKIYKELRKLKDKKTAKSMKGDKNTPKAKKEEKLSESKQEPLIEKNSTGEDVISYLKSCFKRGRLKQVVETVNELINREDFSQTEKQQMKEIEQKARNTSKAIIVLKRQEGIEKAREQSGLSKEEVERLHRIIIMSQNRKNEEEEYKSK